MPTNWRHKIAADSMGSPYVADMSPNPHVERVVVTKYIDKIYGLTHKGRFENQRGGEGNSSY